MGRETFQNTNRNILRNFVLLGKRETVRKTSQEDKKRENSQEKEGDKPLKKEKYTQINLLRTRDT